MKRPDSINRLIAFNLVLIVVFILVGKSFADKMRFEHLTVEQGLSNSTVYSIIQDKAGYLWFGTPNGLNKYDGYKVTVFKNIPGDTTSIVSNNAGNVYLANDGKIWIGSWGGGVDVFDPGTNKAIHYTHHAGNPNSISDNRVQSIFEDSKGNMWLGTFSGGLDLLDRKTGHISHYRHDPKNAKSISNNRVWAIAENYDGKLWVATSRGLNLFDPSNGEFEHFFHSDAEPNSLNHDIVRTLLMVGNSALWIGTTAGFNRLDLKTMRFKRYLYNKSGLFRFNSTSISCIALARDGKLWMGAGRGIYIIDPQTDKLRHIVPDPDDPGSLNDEEIRSLYRDRSGIFWIGTKNKGINKYDPTRKKFNNFISRAPEKYRLKHVELNAVQGGYFNKHYYIFFSNTYGLYRFEPARNDLRFFPFNSIDQNYHRGNFIRSIKFDPWEKNIVWLTTQSRIYRYNLNNDQFYVEDLSMLNSLDRGFSTFTSILLFNNDLWLGNYANGLFRFDRKSELIEQIFTHVPKDSTSLSHNEVYFVQKADTGGIWVGTGTALDYYSLKTGLFTHHRFNKNGANHERRFFCMFQESDNVIWIGTEDGLLRYMPKIGAYNLYTLNDGLPDNQVNSILLDDDHNLWLGTARGLSRLDLRTMQFANFNITDGLINSEYVPNSAYKAEDGTLYFGGKQGLDFFDPKSIKVNHYNPPVVLNSLQIFNKRVTPGPNSVLKKVINASEAIELSYKDYLFSIEFAALDYSKPVKIKYAYKLEGIDSEWLYTTSERRFATYTNVPGGEYTFKVKGTNDDGLWSKQVKTLSIKIVPALWNTFWFRLAGTAFLLAFIGSIFRMRFRSINNRNRELFEINSKLNDQIEMREKAEREKNILQKHLLHAQKMEAIGLLAGGIAHDFNNLLTAIIGNIGLAQLTSSVDTKTGNILGAAEKACLRAKSLTEQLLTFSKGGQPIREAASLQDVVRESSQFVLVGTNVKCEIDYPENLWLADIDKGQISQVIQNLVINARQAMSAGGNIYIKMRNVDEKKRKALNLLGSRYVEMEVRDEGPGIEKKDLENIFTPYFSTKKEGSGLGLAVTYSVIEKHKGLILADSTVGQGTTFHLYLPASSKSSVAFETEGALVQGDVAHILLMDDETAIQEVAKAMLEKLGHRVSVVGDGRQAIEVYKKALENNDKFDAVVMDLTIPGGMGGKEAIKVLRQIDPQIVAIVSSGYSNDPIMASYKEFGFNAIMSKPYTVSELAIALQKALKLASSVTG